jgi:hypothetical protein
MASDAPERRMDDPHADLERTLIRDYLRARGEDVEALRARDDAEAHKLLAEASTYAASKLAELEARAHYVQEIRHVSGE